MRRALLLPAVAALLAVAACDSAADDAVRVDLRAGTTLRYDVSYVSDTTGGGSGPLPPVRRTERVVSVGQTLGDLRGLTVVESREQNAYDPALMGLSRTWYRPTDDRFEEVAYEFMGDAVGTFGLKQATADPALPRLVRQALARHAAARGGGGIVRGPQTRTPARIVIEYPAETGRTWTHFEAPEIGLQSTREVVGTETVRTPAGTFRCAVVRTRLFDGDVEDSSIGWTDWIGSVGLVQRRIVYRQDAFDESGAPLGLVTTTQTDLLVAAE
jgi:hypothetical protein